MSAQNRRRGAGRAWAFAGALLLLAGCAELPHEPNSAASDGSVDTAAAVASLPPEQGKPDDYRPLAPERLMAQDAAAAESLLGQPDMVRREPPAEIWQYRTRACTVDLFFYPSPNDPNRREVVYVEARDTQAEAGDAGDCLGRVAARAARHDG